MVWSWGWGWEASCKADMGSGCIRSLGRPDHSTCTTPSPALTPALPFPATCHPHQDETLVYDVLSRVQDGLFWDEGLLWYCIHPPSGEGEATYPDVWTPLSRGGAWLVEGRD